MEAVEKEAEYFKQFYNGSRMRACDLMRRDEKEMKAEIQKTLAINSLLQFYMQNPDKLPQNTTLMDVVNLSKAPQLRFAQKFPSNMQQIVNNWHQVIPIFPDKFAEAVIEYFQCDRKDLQYFSHITFPNIFNYFITVEFASKAKGFLEALMETDYELEIFGAFFSSFILASPVFNTVLWSQYFVLLSRKECFNESEIIDCLFESLKIAAIDLSSEQADICVEFFNHNADKFAEIFIKNVIKVTFLEKSSQISDIPLKKTIIDTFDYLSEHSDTPQIYEIVEIIKNSNHNLLPAQSLADDEICAKTILFCYDAYLLEDFMKLNHQKLNATYMPSFTLPDKNRGLLFLFTLEVSTHSISKTKNVFNGRLLFPEPAPIPKDKGEENSRLWRELIDHAEKESIDPFNIIMGFQSYTRRITPEFKEYALKRYTSEIKKEIEDGEARINIVTVFNHYSILLASAQAYRGMTIIAGLTNKEDEDKFDEEKPKKNLRNKSFTAERLISNETDSNAAIKQIVSTNMFDESGVKFDNFAKAVTKSPTPTAGKASSFDLDFEEAVEAPKPVKRQRRNSAEFDSRQTAHNFRNLLNMILSAKLKTSSADVKLYAIANFLDSWPSDDRQLESLCEKCSSALSFYRIQKFTDDFCIQHSLQKAIEKTAQKVDAFRYLKRGSMLLAVLEGVSDLINLPGKPEEVDKRFEKLILLCETDAIVRAIIWNARIRFVVSDIRMIIPKRLALSSTFLTRLTKIIETVNPNIASQLSEVGNSF